MNIALLLLCVTGMWHQPKTSRQLPVRQGAALRLIKTDHLRVFHHKRFLEQAQNLAIEGERFIKDLEREWAVVLPHERVTVSLLMADNSKPDPDHLPDDGFVDVIYRQQAKRVELHITRNGLEEITQDQLNQTLRHHLVHVYLDHWESDRLPFFFEEGLAQYYDQTELPTYTYNLILAFNHLEKNPLPEDLDERGFFKDHQGPYYTAVANLFVTDLWHNDPKQEITFIQRHLIGQPMDLTLMNAGLNPFPDLLETFLTQHAELYPMERLVKTADFWAVFCGSLFLAAALYQIIRAAREAMMEHIEIEVAEAIPAPAFAMAAASQPGTNNEPQFPPVGPNRRRQAKEQPPQAAPIEPPPRQDDRDFAAQTTDALVFLEHEESTAPVAPPRRTDDADFAAQTAESLIFIDDDFTDANATNPAAAKTIPTPPNPPASITPPRRRENTTPLERTSAARTRKTAPGVVPLPTPPPRPTQQAQDPADESFNWDLNELEDDLDSAFDLLGGKEN